MLERVSVASDPDADEDVHFLSSPCPAAILGILETARRSACIANSSSSQDLDTSDYEISSIALPSKLAAIAGVGPLRIQSCSHNGKLEGRMGQFASTLSAGTCSGC